MGVDKFVGSEEYLRRFNEKDSVRERNILLFNEFTKRNSLGTIWSRRGKIMGYISRGIEGKRVYVIEPNLDRGN